MSTAKSTPPNTELDLDIRAYKGLNSGLFWYGYSAFDRYFALARIVCLHPEGIPVTAAKREAFLQGDTNVSSKNHQLAKRAFGPVNALASNLDPEDTEDLPEVVPHSDDDSLIHHIQLNTKTICNALVKPTPALRRIIAALAPGMHLSELPVDSWSEASKQHIDSVWSKQVKKWRKRKESEIWNTLIRFTKDPRELAEDDEDDRFAKEVARDYLKSRSEIAEGEDHVREALANQLRIDIEGRQKKIEDGDHFETKFCSTKKAGAVYWRIKNGFTQAARMGYRCGTKFTLTTDSKRHNSIPDAESSLNESLQLLFQRLRSEDPFDGTPDRVAVIEHDNKAHVHAHVVVFGVTAEEFPTEVVQHYWSETRNQGSVVNVRDIGYSDAEEVWNFPHRGRPVDDYLAKSAKWMLDLAEEGNPLELTRRGEDHWKLALLWASDEISQIDRISQSLSGTEEVEPGTIEDTAPDWIDNSTSSDEPTHSRGSVGHLEQLIPTEIAARLLDWITMLFYLVRHQRKPPP